METLILLDTHILVWLYAGEIGLISPEAREAIEKQKLLISPMSLLEIDYLFEIKRVSIRGQKLFEELSENIPIELSEAPFSKVVEHASLLTWTRDPFDRIIVGNASYHKAPLITKDTSIRNNYRCIW